MIEKNNERVNRIYGDWNYEDNIANEDVDWLIDQAKKVEQLQEEIRMVREQNTFLIKGLKQCTQDIEWGESISKHADKIKRIAVETLNNHTRS